ncbi:tetratricopeptide repeat protein [Draconibacterium sp. IB214405]|uniref:tetratricopeptide repeat protein n=1 Tax=Draconibacterium sp. IB214405 TaxID=3097352 RepID=UPI002A1230DF|nr:tetratricopeptide repeat protein [Draconibacterium sp. IB214405]MDX8340121.1 tetratricopeptide repeat protein [Draconibacterium sp. IB214405]
MNDKDLKIKYDSICNHLAERKLKPAFDLLENLIRESGLLIHLDEWRNLEQNYSYMLKYTVEGIQDPERQKVYQKLIVSVFELNDKIYDELRLKMSSSVTYEKKRGYQPEKINFTTLLDELEDFYLQEQLVQLVDDAEVQQSSKRIKARDHQQKVVSLFYFIWFQNELNDEHRVFLKAFFNSELIEKSYKSFIISAVLMSLLRYFDEAKFSILFDAYELGEADVNQRALVGLLIGFYRYDSRLPYYPAIIGRLKLLNENPEFKQNIEQIIIQLIRSKETEKIQKKITDEIMPEMIKISPNLKDKINLDSLMDNALGDDENPEWEKIFEDSPGLMNKMEEFSELQMEGADVFMSSFAMLKMFPFFSEFANWFMPFFPKNPEIDFVVNRNDSINERFINVIAQAPVLCNSDKYSFCFSLQNIPAENREFMAEGLNAEMQQFEEMKNDEKLTEPGKMAGYVSNLYIQDLYRFFKLHPRKNDFEDIFNWRFDFHNQQTLGEILKEETTIVRNIAEYYFSKNYYNEAAEVFNYLLNEEKSGELYQKLGYCYQKLGDFEQALKAYKSAELFELNKKWNLNKIALCYRNLKQPQEALAYYREVELLDEDNLNVQLNIGHCLLELERFEEALKTYFKVEYLMPDNKKVWKPIGWCSLIAGKFEQAEKYFKKLIDDAPNKHDLMNMGHVQWCLGKRKEALDYYKQSIVKTEFTEREFFEVFHEDLHYLIGLGIDKDDVPIMLDQLRYFVEE